MYGWERKEWGISRYLGRPVPIVRNVVRPWLSLVFQMCGIRKALTGLFLVWRWPYACTTYAMDFWIE